MIIYETNNNQYDVIVVGSGPAGITAALRIAEKSSLLRLQ